MITVDFTSEEIQLLMKILSSTEEDSIFIDEIYNKLDQADCQNDDNEDIISNAPYKLSDNQIQFIRDALNQGLTINWEYSGRGMFGAICPAVIGSSFNSKSDFSYDSMGLKKVFYAKR